LDRLCIIKKNLLISLVDPQSQLHLQPSSKASAERLRQNGEHLPLYQTMTWKIEFRVANSGQESPKFASTSGRPCGKTTNIWR
jgi:hypothetical protein